MTKPIKSQKKNIPKSTLSNHTNQSSLSYMCPNCRQQIITIDHEVTENIFLNCPACGKQAILRPFPKKQSTTRTSTTTDISVETRLIGERKNINLLTLEIKIFGIFLVILGCVLHFVVNLFSIKINLIVIIIGVIIFAFIPSNRKILVSFSWTDMREKQNKKLNTHHSSVINYLNNTLLQIDISEKIAIVLILWIIFIYLLTGVNNIDLFFIFVYLGILIIKVFSNELTPVHIRKRINIFTIAFLFIFLLIIIRRILLISNILS